MNKEDIEKAVADLVEAVRIDAAIVQAHELLRVTRRNAREAYFACRSADEQNEFANVRYRNLMSNRPDIDALKERLSSLLAGGNISTK